MAAPDSAGGRKDVPSAGETAAADLDTAPPLAQFGLGARGYLEARVIIHLHSAFSHDGCDDQGLAADGTPNWTCIHRMKAALCAERLSVAFMTDHPSHMKEQPFDALLYAEAGDRVTKNSMGEAVAVAYACPAGTGGLGGEVVLVPGFEGTHTMPIGLTRHLDDAGLYGVSYETETPSESLAAVSAAAVAAGGLVAIAHSEDDDLDAATIAAHDVAAMEIYNFHANFQEKMEGGDLMLTLFGLEPFLDPAPGAPPADLVALLMLDAYPEAALTKWRDVSRVRPITGVVGSDVHENVILPAICADNLCEGFGAEYPNLVVALAAEGNLVLNDGDRIDSYARIFRWLQNRVWIQPGEDVLAATREALAKGRHWNVFEVLGDVREVDLHAVGPDGAVYEVGSVLPSGAAGGGYSLAARSPAAPVPGRVATWTEGAPAQIETTLYRIHAGGVDAVATWAGAGVAQEVPIALPGAYYLEVWITPLHLAPVLGSVSALAEHPFRWAVSNALRVE